MLNDFLKSGFKLEKLVNLKIFNKRIKDDRFVFNRKRYTLKLIGIFFRLKILEISIANRKRYQVFDLSILVWVIYSIDLIIIR